MFTITRKSDSRVLRAFVHKLADIPNGVTVATTELVNGGILPEEGKLKGYELNRAIVGKDSSTGVYHLIKTAVLAANAANDATTYTVKKGHHFKVGDFISAGIGKKAYAITAIATNSGDATCDDLSVGTTLGVAISAGEAIVQAAAQATGNTSALKYAAPYAVVGDSYNVVAGTNIFAQAWLIGVIKGALAPAAPADVIAKVPGVQFI